MAFIIVGTIALILYCPTMAILCAITPWKGFRISSIRHRGRRYKTLHLAALDRVGAMNRHQATKFHRSFITQLTKAIRDDSDPVFFTSHLLRPAHVRSMKMTLSATPTHHLHCRKVRIPPGIRTGIRIQILIQEWRWITVPPTGALVVIKPRRIKHN